MQGVYYLFSFLLIISILQTIITIIWKFFCLFRKKGSCKFVKCPFRKNYTNTSQFYFPSFGCTKCPPTPKEEMIWNGSLDGVITNLIEKDKRGKKRKAGQKKK